MNSPENIPIIELSLINNPKKSWQEQLILSLDNYITNKNDFPCFYETNGLLALLFSRKDEKIEAVECLIKHLNFLLGRGPVPTISVFPYSSVFSAASFKSKLQTTIREAISTTNDFPYKLSPTYTYWGIILYVSFLNYTEIWKAKNGNSDTSITLTFSSSSCASQKWEDQLIAFLQNLRKTKEEIKNTTTTLQQLFLMILIDHLNYHKSERGSYSYPQISLYQIYSYGNICTSSLYTKLNEKIKDSTIIPKKIQQRFNKEGFDEFICMIERDNLDKCNNHSYSYSPPRRGTGVF